MIGYLVNFALNNRILVLALGVLLLIWGIISFHNLPVEQVFRFVIENDGDE